MKATIGGISLFLTLSLSAMESNIYQLENSLDKTEWPTLLSSWSHQNLIPNKFEINEINNNNPTHYTALNNIFPENTFSVDLDETEYAKLEKDPYGPTLNLVICPKNEQVLMTHHQSIGPSKPEKKILYSNHPDRITSFAYKNHTTKEIVVGRNDGSITLYDIGGADPLYYERNCSLNPISSVAFDDNGHVIATDEEKFYIINPKTNILLSITGPDIRCPSLMEEQILVVQKPIIKLSPDIPYQFFTHTVTDEQYRLLRQFAHLKKRSLNKQPLGSHELQEMRNDLDKSNFEPLVKQELENRLKWAMSKTSKLKKPGILTAIKENAVGCLKILQQCYTELTQPLTPETTTSDAV